MKEKRNRAFEWILARYQRSLDWALSHRKQTVFGSIGVFALSILIASGIGAEFMPHLDEGALWVRATMPYTISFEESSRIVPQVRAILRSFPEVTDVASEHGRADDGTDPTGFFNAEFYVGLKPYAQWNGKYHSKADLIAAIDKKLETFPGVHRSITHSPPKTRSTRLRPGLRARSTSRYSDLTSTYWSRREARSSACLQA